MEAPFDGLLGQLKTVLIQNKVNSKENSVTDQSVYPISRTIRSDGRCVCSLSPTYPIEQNRTKNQSNPIELQSFDWVGQSNKIEHLFCCEFDFRTNRTNIIEQNRTNPIPRAYHAMRRPLIERSIIPIVR